MQPNRKYAFVLVTATGYGFQEEGYSDAETNVEMEFEECFEELYEEFIDWLDANFGDRYDFDYDFLHVDHFTVECIKLVRFREEADAVAFKLAWPQFKEV